MEKYQQDEMTVGKWKNFHKNITRLVDELLIKGFSPFYFISIMGMGISSNLLYAFPYDKTWLQNCGYVMFGCACSGFIVVFTSFIVAIIKHPNNLIQYHTNPKIAPYMGCLPMAYMTLVNFIWLITAPDTSVLVFVLWVIAMTLSLYSSGIIFFFTFLVKLKHNKLQFNQLNLTIMFPAVAVVVCASEGNYLVPYLPENLKLFTFIASFSLLSIGSCMAFTIIIINFWKLFIYKLPPTQLIFTSFLPVGYVGQAGCCIMLIGNNMKYLLTNGYFPSLSHHDIVGETVLVISGGICLFLTSFGYFMTFVAIASVLSKTKPFNTTNPHPEYTKNGYLTWFRGFWALTFPLGTMSLAQNELSLTFKLEFFKVMSSIYGSGCIICTVVCMIGVIYRTLTLAYQTMTPVHCMNKQL